MTVFVAMFGLIGGALAGGAARAEDPWRRPEHLRALVVPATDWSDRAKDRPVRLFWDGSDRATVQVLRRGHWRTLSTAAASGFTTRPLPADAVLRVQLHDAARWSPILQPDPVSDPVATGRLGGWGGADVVGQLALDRRSGDIYASTVGGGLLVRSAGDQPLAGTTAQVGRWRVLGRADGLPDARVVAVDARDGTALVGTAGGLAVLHGDQVAAVVDSELPDPYVQAVHVGATGDWWVGTFQGLSHRPANSASYQTLLEPWSVFSLAEARGGGVWVGYEGLRHVAADGTVTPWLADLHAYDVVDTPDGPVAATTEEGLLLVSEPGVATALSRVVDRDAYGVALGPGGLWVAAGGTGLVDPQGNLWGRGAGLPAEGVRSVLAMPDGSLFVGTDGGLARVVPRSGPPLIDAWMASQWPATSPVAQLALTPDGLWVAGANGIQVAGRPHASARDLVVAAGDENSVVVTDPSGDVYAVGERVVRLARSGTLDAWWPPARISTGAYQEGAGLYVGGADGLWRLEPDRDRFVPISTLRDVHAVAQSPRGLWVAADSSVFRVVGTAVTPYLETHIPLALSAAPDGVWVGTRDGLERLRLTAGGPVVDDILGEDDALVGIPAVAATPDGVWFATESGQVGRIAGDRVGLATLTTIDPPTITALAPDGDSVWVGTDGGVYRVFLPPSALSDTLPAPP